MRSILRAAAKTVRVFLLLVKSLLLLLTVAVLVLWPVSRGKYLSASESKWTAQPERVDYVTIGITCFGGRMGAWRGTAHYLSGWRLAVGRESAEVNGEGWQRHATSIYRLDFPDASFDGWGPLRWKFLTTRFPDYTDEVRYIALPCCVIAPLLAVWPLTSLTLSLRRRTRRRRRLATGCCLSCGYDLRATPSAGGERLVRCPECGASSWR